MITYKFTYYNELTCLKWDMLVTIHKDNEIYLSCFLELFHLHHKHIKLTLDKIG